MDANSVLFVCTNVLFVVRCRKGDMPMYDGCHTAFDVMKEYLILGAELDGKYQIPIVPTCSFD